MRLLLAIFGILIPFLLSAADIWVTEINDGGRACPSVKPDEELLLTVPRPGKSLIYQEKNRTTLRMTRDEWNRTTLVFEVKVSDTKAKEVRGTIFVKDKDGWWFQSPNEFRIKPGEWQRLELDISPEKSPLAPLGHQGAWSGYFAVSRIAAGLSLYGADDVYTIACRPPQYTGERQAAPLKILDWQLPDAALVNDVMQSTFLLSEEFFNPFDPDDIAVDFEVRKPDGTIQSYPAFYTVDYQRTRHFTTEFNKPDGRPYWAFRYTPEQSGEYSFRVLARAADGRQAATPWRSNKAEPTLNKGFIRVAPNQHNLRFANGELYYPIGINIHTNVDLRSEIDFEFGHLPDQGTYDYDEYFTEMSKNGINAVEIWMAAWNFAIEWNSSRRNYHGLGRYNLCNASRLDHVLSNARSKNMYIHLALDNHTKNTSLEWGDNPFNSQNEFGAANGAFLENSESMFSDEKARIMNRKRNRYIAARWGSEPAIWGIEFWSEIDLVPKFREMYENETMLKWHSEAAADFRAMDQGRHLLTTHYCGDYLRLLNYYKLMILPELDYVVGDAYRGPQRIHFIDLIRSHAGAVGYFERPVIITEYGGPSSGKGNASYRLGDIHCANWLALLLGMPATPFTWWHDFVHIKNYYPHYKGFVDFIKRIDLTLEYEYQALSVGKREDWIYQPLSAPSRTGYNRFLNGAAKPAHLDFGYNYTGYPVGRNYVIQGMSMSRSNFVAGWIFCSRHMNSYPEDNTPLEFFQDYVFELDRRLTPGRYLITFCDTVTNRVIDRQEIQHNDPEELLLISVPAFKTDIAFKVELMRPW